MQERSLEVTEVLWCSMERGDGDRKPVCKYFGSKRSQKFKII